MSLPSRLLAMSSSVSADASQVFAPFSNGQEQDLFFTFKADGLAAADFIVVDFEVNEKLSCPYRIDITLASRTPDHNLAQLTDKGAHLVVHDRYQTSPRYFHGIVCGAVRANRGHRFTQYQVSLMPQLHRLRYGSDCRIFQERDIVDIAKTILVENGVSHLEDLTTGKHEKREYATQYHETHFDFVNRILAEEGIFY